MKWSFNYLYKESYQNLTNIRSANWPYTYNELEVLLYMAVATMLLLPMAGIIPYKNHLLTKYKKTSVPQPMIYFFMLSFLKDKMRSHISKIKDNSCIAKLLIGSSIQQ